MADPDGSDSSADIAAEDAAPEAGSAPVSNGSTVSETQDNGIRSVRVNAKNLDRLLSLSGESLVESRRLKPFTASILRLKRTQREAGQALDLLHQQLSAQTAR